MTTTALDNNFNLTEETFNQLKEQLRRGDETLFETIFLAHFKDCMSYLEHQFRMPKDKSYDVTMDALLAFRRKLLEGKIRYGNLRFLFTQLASHLYLKEVGRAPSKDLKKEVQALMNEDRYELDDHERERLRRAWARLGEGCKDLLKWVYYYNAMIKDVAQAKEVSAATLRKQKQRCVDKLKTFFKEA